MNNVSERAIRQVNAFTVRSPCPASLIKKNKLLPKASKIMAIMIRTRILVNMRDGFLIEISYLFILPEYQKKGVGSILIKSCEDIVKKFDIKKIKLGAEPKSIEFYFKHGYIKTGELFQSAVFDNLTYPYVEKHL